MLALARLDHRLRPLLARLLSPAAFTKLYSTGRKPFLERLARADFAPVEAPRRPLKLWDLDFRHDLGNAAGLDKDGSLLEFNYRLGAGFAVVGTVLAEAHTGNLFPMWGKPRNAWVPLPGCGSAINSLGLPSQGITPALAAIRAFKEAHPQAAFPIGISIMGHPLHSGQQKLDGILHCVELSLGVADFIEINESCPNVAHKADDSLEERLRSICALRDAQSGRRTPILTKFASLAEPASACRLFAAAGLQGIVLTNTQRDYASFRPTLTGPDAKIFAYYTSTYQGGLSGEMIRERALAAVIAARQAIDEAKLDLKIIHVGGLSKPAHMAASRPHAELREWYTGLMEQLAARPLHRVYKDMVE